MKPTKTHETAETQIKFIKQQRVDLDEILQELLNHYSEDVSSETWQATIRLKECIMWLGMELKRLGAQNPYPQSYNPDNAIVHPTADGLKL